MNGTYLTVISRLFFKKKKLWHWPCDFVIKKKLRTLCERWFVLDSIKSCMFILKNFIKLKHKLNRKMLDMFLWDGINWKCCWASEGCQNMSGVFKKKKKKNPSEPRHLYLSMCNAHDRLPIYLTVIITLWEMLLSRSFHLSLCGISLLLILKFY